MFVDTNIFLNFYDHTGGLQIQGFENRQWVALKCAGCGEVWSFWKIYKRLNEKEETPVEAETQLEKESMIPPQEVPFEIALKFIPNQEKIHTWRPCGIVTVGADMKRAEILELLQKFPIQIAGPMAQKNRHGFIVQDEEDPLFIETTEDVSHLLKGE
jgi:hypothetical protein